MVRGVLEKHVSGKTRLKFRAGVFIVQKKAKLNRKTFFHVWNISLHILEGSN